MRRSLSALLVLTIAMAPAVASATSHLWRITEVFSDESGEIQFIELHEILGDDLETHLHEFGMYVKTIFKTWYFPRDLDGPTGHKYMLVATPAFAALPGAPMPDYIIDDELLPGFFQTTFDIIVFRNELNSFSTVSFTFAELPLDGLHSLHIDHETGERTVAPNSPTNFAGDTATVPVATLRSSMGELKSRYE